MRTMSLSLSSLLLGCVLVRAAPAGAADAVEVYARGDYAGAVRLLAPLHEAGKANIQQRLILARAYLHLSRSGEAMAVLKSVLEADRENPEANALTGRILLAGGKPKEAVEYLEHAHRLKPEAPTASALGRCYYALGRPVKAKARLTEALAADIRDPGNSLLLGKICLSRGMGALAEKYLLMAEEAGLDSPELFELLARAYLMQRKYVGPVRSRRLSRQKARQVLLPDGVVLRPAAGTADRYLVTTRYCGLHEGLRLLKARPESVEARYVLARCWLAAGDADEARRQHAALAAQEPASRRTIELKLELALAGEDPGAMKTALAGARAAEVVPARRLADLYCRAGMILRARGRRQAAVDMFGRAEELAPADERALRSLATMHLAAGRKMAARRYYARLVELFPDAGDIDALRNTLRVLGGSVDPPVTAPPPAETAPASAPATAPTTGPADGSEKGGAR